VRRTTTTPGGCVAGCDWVGGIAGRRAPSTPGVRVVHPISSSDRQAIHAVARCGRPSARSVPSSRSPTCGGMTQFAKSRSTDRTKHGRTQPDPGGGHLATSQDRPCTGRTSCCPHGGMWSGCGRLCGCGSRTCGSSAWGSESVDVSRRKTATVHRELPSLAGREV
jgi:hypothetical protein